ncbi:MAG TPA: zinc ribbon domain-containing protein [Thermoleophilaceae bacterium]|nr:zinc ribbon domain-containing protein [Thermoleophilaceae bacterium]
MTEESCPNCGEPVERRQLVCLNCGARVALEERTSWAREPVTALATALVVVIVIGAGLFGFAISELTSDDGDGGGDGASRQAASEGPAVVSGGEQPTRTAEEAPAVTETVPAEESPGSVPGWPKGVTAHTVVLVTSSDRAAALRVAKEARGTGLEAGLMRSDPYDLGSGLWIVFSGRFTTPEGAQAQAAQLDERYPGAYPQLIQRSQ